MEVGRNPPTLAKWQLKDTGGIQRSQVEGRPHPSLPATEMEEKVSRHSGPTTPGRGCLGIWACVLTSLTSHRPRGSLQHLSFSSLSKRNAQTLPVWSDEPSCAWFREEKTGMASICCPAAARRLTTLLLLGHRASSWIQVGRQAGAVMAPAPPCLSVSSTSAPPRAAAHSLPSPDPQARAGCNLCISESPEIDPLHLVP